MIKNKNKITMKAILIGCLSLMSVLTSFSLKAQQVNPAADLPYLKNKNFPVFSLTSIDGKEVTNKDLPKNYKYTCVIIFSPDCSHCEHEAAELSKNADKFKNVLFIWDSYREMDLIKKFAVKYNLAGKPNIVIGRDGAYTLPTFFRPKMTPFVALYYKGSFVKVWEQGVEVPELIKNIQGK
jgi:thiol-disulfide isomerase/thioredoxin